MNWSASVLSSATSDTEPTIVVNFDSGKYIFNAGENTGRSWLQSRRNWRKARGIFLTSVGTQRCSGLPGLLMFFADARIKGVDVVGPQGLMHYLASMRSYLWRVTMSLNTTEVPFVSGVPDAHERHPPEPVYTDENIRLYAVPIHASHSPTPLAEQSTSLPAKRKRSLSPVIVSKRLAKEEHPAVPDSEENELQVVSLLERIRKPGFSPADLSAADVQEWRRMVIANMFPHKPPTPEEEHAAQKQAEAQRKQERKSKAAQQNGELALHHAESSIVPTFTTASPRPIYNAAHMHQGRRLPSFRYPDNDITRKATLCYVLVGPRPRGKFDVAKADALGVKGTWRAKLTKGEIITITVDDGHGNTIERTVRPEDCIGPSEVPQAMVVLDVPTPAHIPAVVASFTENPFFAHFRSKAEKDRNEHNVHAVFHLCGSGVLEDERYKAFMRGFADDTHHIVSSREHGTDPVTFTSAAFTQLRLNKLDPDMFPVHKFSQTPRRDLSLVPGLPPRTELMQSNRLIDIRPPREPCHDVMAQSYDYFHLAIASKTGIALPGHIAQRFAAAKAKVDRFADAMAADKRPGDNVEIIPLGTSSALPSKYRNVSSTLVRIPEWGSMLLDAGEGTWGQLARMYGDDVGRRSDGVWEVLRDLKCIFLSHMHGDHHIGLAKILAMRKLMNPPPTQPLYVIGLRATLIYLREQSEVEDLSLALDNNGVVTILADTLNWRPAQPYRMNRQHDDEPCMDEEASRKAAAEMCRALGLDSFTTVDVVHRTRCYGAVLKHSDNWSLVYSADTCPTNNLVRAGRDATLLIHEATMADDQEEMAQEKAHSTCGQAIDIGRRMNAENLLLTHFSARYPKMPPIETTPPSSPSRSPSRNSPRRSRGPRLALAFDHTKVKIGDMWKLNAYLPAIERNFAETAAEEGDEEQENTSFSW